MAKAVKITLALTFLIGSLGPMGGNLILPMISVLKNEFYTDVSMIMLSITMFMIPFALVQFISGGLSDIYGRRRLIAAGMLIYGLGFVLASMSRDIWAFIATRVVQGAGNALAAPVLIAVIGDVTDPATRGRYMGFYSSAIRAGIAVAPFIGGLMAYQWRLLFMGMAALSFSLAACSWICLRGLRTGEGRSNELVEDLKETLKYKGVIAVSAAGFVTFFSYIALMSLTSDALTSFPYFLDPSSVGLILSVSGIVGIVSSSIAGFLTDKFGRRIIPTIGASAAALSLIVLVTVTRYPSPLYPFYFIPNVLEQGVQGINQTFLSLLTFQTIARAVSSDVYLAFLILMSSMGVGISFIWPALLALSVELVPPNRRGASASIFNGMRFLGYAIAPAAFTPVYLQMGLDVAYILSAALLVLVIGMVYLVAGKGEQ